MQTVQTCRCGKLALPGLWCPGCLSEVCGSLGCCQILKPGVLIHSVSCPTLAPVEILMMEIDYRQDATAQEWPKVQEGVHYGPRQSIFMLATALATSGGPEGMQPAIANLLEDFRALAGFRVLATMFAFLGTGLDEHLIGFQHEAIRWAREANLNVPVHNYSAQDMALAAVKLLESFFSASINLESMQRALLAVINDPELGKALYGFACEVASADGRPSFWQLLLETRDQGSVWAAQVHVDRLPARTSLRYRTV